MAVLAVARLRENVYVASAVFETRAIPLQLVPVVALLLFWVGIVVNMLVGYRVYLQQKGLTTVAIGIAGGFGFLLCLALISLFFHKVKVENGGITFQTPYIRLLRYKPFPIHISFDEMHIKQVWSGRVLVFTDVKELKWTKRALLFGGIWVMPIKRKECIRAIKTIKPEVFS